MNIRQLAQVGLGLVGVWALMSAVEVFIQIAAVVGSSAGRLGIAEAVPVLLLLGLSYLLIFENAKVAAAIFPGMQGTTGETPSDLARTVVALTGVLLLARALPSAVNALLLLPAAGALDPSAHGQMVRSLAGLAIPIGTGLYLMMRPDRFLAYVERVSATPAAERAD